MTSHDIVPVWVPSQLSKNKACFKIQPVLLKFLSFFRILLTGKFIVSSSYDKTARSWSFDTEHLGAGREGEALVQTFTGHTKGVYPMVYIPR